MYPTDRAQTANFAVDSRASTDPLGRETIDKLPAAPDPPERGPSHLRQGQVCGSLGIGTHNGTRAFISC